MVSLKLLELVKPDRYLLEYLTYVIATKNIELIDVIRKIIKFWLNLKMETDLLITISKQLENLEEANKYITLSQKIEFYEQLYAEDLVNLLYKYSIIADLYYKIKDFEDANYTLENYADIITSHLIEIQEILEKNENIGKDTNINILNMQDILNSEIQEYNKYVSFIPEIDALTNGFSPGLYLFAGVLGSGKSSILLNLTVGFNIFVNLFEDMLKEKITEGLTPSVIYISFENTYEQTILRLKSIIDDSPINKIVANMTPLKLLYSKLKNDKLIIANLLYENATMVNIERLIKQIIFKGYHPTIILVDYMDEIYITENLEHRHKLGLAAKFLRNLSMKYNSLVVTATQLNRKGFEGKISIANLSESIEHAKKADVIVGLATGKADLITIKESLPIFSEEDKNNNQNKGLVVNLNVLKYPVMHLSLQKNRFGLILNKVNILSSPNSNIGFTSLVNGLNWNISLDITNFKLDIPDLYTNIFGSRTIDPVPPFIKMASKDVYLLRGDRYYLEIPPINRQTYEILLKLFDSKYNTETN